MELQAVVHALVELVEQVGKVADELFVRQQVAVIATYVNEDLVFLRDNALAYKLLQESIIDIVIITWVESARHQQHACLGEYDVGKEFLLACLVCCRGKLLAFVADSVLIDVDDIEESGRAFRLTIFYKAELLVIGIVEEEAWVL